MRGAQGGQILQLYPFVQQILTEHQQKTQFWAQDLVPALKQLTVSDGHVKNS